MPMFAVTRYTLPSGARDTANVMLTDDTYSKAGELALAGYVFEVEMLRNGMMSATFGDPLEEIDHVIELSHAPDVQDREAFFNHISAQFETVALDAHRRWLENNRAIAGTPWKDA